MLRTSSPLVAFYERCIDWMRGRSGRQLRHPGGPIRPVRVDLVGDDGVPTFGTAKPLDAPSPKASTLPPAEQNGGGALTNPFRSTLASSQSSLAKAWTFNQTVLLSPRRRSSSVLVWTAVGSVVAVGIWSVTAPLAETIAVQGKLEPGSSTKRIDTPVPGVVEAVLVKEGQSVRKGDPLVRFDLREPRSKLAAAEDVRKRLLNENQIAAITLGETAGISGLTGNQQRQLLNQSEAFASRRQGVREELAKARTTLAGARTNLTTYRNIANRYAVLVAQGAASEVQLLTTRQQAQDAATKVGEAEREVARQEAALRNTGASDDLELRRKMEENLRQISQLDSDIRTSRQQIQYGELKAPADGLVFDLEVNPGSVVGQGTGTNASTSTKPLLKIVPFDALQARVYLPNSAVGFVRPGLKADLSVDAFRASDFGYIHAQVLRVGSDALTADEQARELGTDTKGLYYPAVLLLDRQTIDLRRKKVPLQAGMTVTADLRLRERRFINILTGFFEDQRRNLERLR
jgi:hemolysin D